MTELKRGAYGLRPATYYAKCMFGGVLACGVTHAAVVTLDVNKCRTQAHRFAFCLEQNGFLCFGASYMDLIASSIFTFYL
tara:strand:+ start:1354 stop:1593 length:240 start_codon:yes stop_codon:yes gene_type:complete